MQCYRLGDRVRIDIPDEMDPDFEFHAEHGIVIDVTETHRGLAYRVGLEQMPIVMDVTSEEVRPPIIEQEFSR